MTFTFFRIEDMLSQMPGANLMALLTAAACLHLWHHRKPKVSPRKVRVERDELRYRRRYR